MAPSSAAAARRPRRKRQVPRRHHDDNGRDRSLYRRAGTLGFVGQSTRTQTSTTPAGIATGGAGGAGGGTGLFGFGGAGGTGGSAETKSGVNAAMAALAVWVALLDRFSGSAAEAAEVALPPTRGLTPSRPQGRSTFGTPLLAGLRARKSATPQLPMSSQAERQTAVTPARVVLADSWGLAAAAATAARPRPTLLRKPPMAAPAAWAVGTLFGFGGGGGKGGEATNLATGQVPVSIAGFPYRGPRTRKPWFRKRRCGRAAALALSSAVAAA